MAFHLLTSLDQSRNTLDTTYSITEGEKNTQNCNQQDQNTNLSIY